MPEPGPDGGRGSDPPGGRRLATAVTVIGLIGGVLGILTWFGIEWADDQRSLPPPTPSRTADPVPPSDDRDDPVTGAPVASGPTHDEYVATADDVCARWFSTLPGSASDFAEAVDNTIRIELVYQNAINEWQSLQPPTGEREQVDEIIDLNYQFLHELEDAGAAFRSSGDPNYLTEVGGNGSVAPRLRRLSQEYGLRVCTPPL